MVSKSITKRISSEDMSGLNTPDSNAQNPSKISKSSKITRKFHKSSTKCINIFSCSIHAIILLIALSSLPTNAMMFSHNSPTLIFSSWTSTTNQNDLVSLGFNFKIFGSGELDQIYISTYGAISYNNLMQADIVEHATDNIVLAPFFTATSAGSATSAVKHEIGTGQFLNAAAANVISWKQKQPEITNTNFNPTNGVLVSWVDVGSEIDSSDKATFQVFIVTDGDESYAVFHYERIDFTEDINSIAAGAGLYVNSEDVNACWHQINGTSLDIESLIYTTNCDHVGRWVFQLHEELECNDKFTTACIKAEAGEWTTEQGYFENTDKWDYFVRYECKPGNEMLPNVTVKDSYCVYDPDYYESKWSCEDPPKCQDLDTAKNFEVTFTLAQLNQVADVDLWFLGPDDPGYEAMMNQIMEAIEELLSQSGLEESFIVDVDIYKITVSIDRELNGGDDPVNAIKVEVNVLVPQSTKEGVNEHDIETAIEDTLNDLNDVVKGVTFLPDIDVKDKTPACLTMCLGCKKPGGCFGQPPPVPLNACCGTCSSDGNTGGKAYSTLTHQCCGDSGLLLDPTTHTCCHYNGLWTKVKGNCDGDI